MNLVKGVLDYMWWSSSSSDNAVQQEEREESLDVLAEAATTVRHHQSRKRGRLDTYSPGKLRSRPLQIDVSNRGIARMLEMKRVRFGVDEERSTLIVFFADDRQSRRRRRSATSGRFQLREEEEYPYLGSAVDELAEHIQSEGIHDVYTLAAMYPAGFWNVVYTVGTDVDELTEKLFTNHH